MNQEDNLKKLDELLPILMESHLSDSQKKELDQILLSDDKARKYYENYIDTHIALDWHFAGNSLDLPSGLESEITEKKVPKKFPVTTFILSLAALIVLSFLVQTPSQKGHFQVTNSVSANWDKNYKVGDQIATGKIKINSGYGEFKNTDGVKLILEGPAELDVISKDKVILNKGKVVAYVPEDKTGFIVDTPKTEVLDLGTEFGVTVEENGDTEIHVLDGKVETSTAGQKALIKESEAQIFTAEETTLTKADSGRFMRVLPEKRKKNTSFIHWSFNEGKGQEAAYNGVNLPDKNFNAYFRSTYENGPLPKWIDGKFGKALDFDATGGYLETDYPGIGGANARTVSFWVKIPEDAVEENAISMIAWGSYRGKGNTWQISWNWRPQDGTVGALRAGLFHGQIVGTKDLRDGQWHHVSVVLFSGDRPNVNTHILLYVDGQLEPTSRKSILDVQTDIKSKKSIKVLMGRDAKAYVKQYKKQNVFNGSMDEVYIFNSALNESQIRSLMNYNKPISK